MTLAGMRGKGRAMLVLLLVGQSACIRQHTPRLRVQQGGFADIRVSLQERDDLRRLCESGTVYLRGAWTYRDQRFALLNRSSRVSCDEHRIVFSLTVPDMAQLCSAHVQPVGPPPMDPHDRVGGAPLAESILARRPTPMWNKRCPAGTDEGAGAAPILRDTPPMLEACVGHDTSLSGPAMTSPASTHRETSQRGPP